MFALYRERNGEAAAAACARIHQACFPQAWDVEAFQKLLSNPACAVFMAQEAEQPIAMVLLQIVGEEAEIITFGVMPEVRREGIGSGLLWFAEKALGKEGCRKILLEVSADNKAAVTLYERMEYAHIGRRKNYYGGTIDAVCLSKQLEI